MKKETEKEIQDGEVQSPFCMSMLGLDSSYVQTTLHQSERQRLAGQRVVSLPTWWCVNIMWSWGALVRDSGEITRVFLWDSSRITLIWFQVSLEECTVWGVMDYIQLTVSVQVTPKVPTLFRLLYSFLSVPYAVEHYGSGCPSICVILSTWLPWF